MSKAGRDERGRWVRDDTIISMAMLDIAQAISLCAETIEDRTILARINAHLYEARTNIAMLDVGTKPKGDDDGRD